MKRQRLRRILWVGWLLFGGCTTSGPWGGTADMLPPDAAAADEPTGGSEYSRLAEAFPDQTIVPPSQQATPTPLRQSEPSWGDRLVDSVQEKSAAVAEALTPQPRRTAPYDPVRLDSQPQEVGGDLHYRAARVYEKQNDLPRAVQHYQQALELEPEDVNSLVGLARVFSRMGDFRQAEGFYEQALEIQPQNAAVLNDLGLCRVKQQRLDAAIETLGRAAQLRPESRRYRNNLATVLVDAGRRDEAFEHLAAVHGEAIAHYNLGYLLAGNGRTAPARQHLEMALRADPQLQSARQMLAQLGPAVQQGIAAPARSQLGSEQLGGERMHAAGYQSSPPLQMRSLPRP